MRAIARTTTVKLAAAAVLGVVLVLGAFGSPSVSHALPGGSMNVAYVFDGSAGGSGLGSGGPGSGTDIFANRGLPACTSGTSCGYAGVTFTNVSLATIDAGGLAVLTPTYDTVILYQTCHIGDAVHAPGRGAINSFLAAGGKVVIFDADGCYTTTAGPNQAAVWSGFLFPFATTSPGPQGAPGSYTFVEPNTLTTGLLALAGCGPTSPPDCVIPPDAVGDANVFDVTKPIDPAWCKSIQGKNTLGTTENIQAYARTPAGGLAIYEGEDYWFPYTTASLQAHLKKVLDNIVAQKWNPDGLPCTAQVAPGPAVGGIADLQSSNPGSSALADTGSGLSADDYAAIAGVGAGAVMALALAGWYTRRRWLS